MKFRLRTLVHGSIWTCGLISLWGCATMSAPRPVGPGDIPDLQARAAAAPNDAQNFFLLAAALADAERCDESMVAARRGRTLDPADATGALLLGQCLEETGQYGEALTLYGQYMAEYEDEPGAQAVEGRRTVALREQARQTARAAVANEESLGPANPETVGVLPFLVDGTDTYQPLSVGLAHMLTTDLALLARFPMVERVELAALLEELELDPELIDPATAARTGRLMRASRMILGTVSVPSSTEVRLGSNIVLETGELVEPLAADGGLNDLIDLEKELALEIAQELGYELTQAERQRILDNRPASLGAFLAFSRGLLEEDRGNYQAAMAHYSDAVNADPSYEEAQERLGSATGISMVPEQLSGLLMVPEMPVPSVTTLNALAGTMASSIMDLASHQPERATIQAGTGSSIVDVLPEGNDVVPLLEAVITIIITIPR